MLESDACCCFCLCLVGSEMVDWLVAVAQLAEEHVSSHRGIRMMVAEN